MKKVKFVLYIVIILLVLLFFVFLSAKTKAQNNNTNFIGTLTGTATIVNTGYPISFSGSDGGAGGIINYSTQYNVSNNSMTGYAWSPEYGWIQFSGSTGNVLSFQNNNDHENPDWANGHISLIGTNGGTSGVIHYSVVFNPLTNHFDTINHWAWGGNVIGWIDFSNVNLSIDYCPNIPGVQNSPFCPTTITDVCPNIDFLQVTVPAGMIIDPGTGFCVNSPVPPNPTPSGPSITSITINGLTTITWQNALDCHIYSNPTSSDVWPMHDFPGSGSGSVGNLTFSQTTVFTMDCGDNINHFTVVCVKNTQTPAGYSCLKPPVIIEN